MRIRTIKPQFYRHLDLFRAERETGLPLRLSFTGLWGASDREGRFKWRPEELKLDILPYDEIDFSRVLHALLTREFVVAYVGRSGNRGDVYGWVPSFLRHQIINNRESPSILPDPQGCERLSADDPRVGHASATRLNLDQGEGEMEGKGREGEKERDSAADAAIPTPPAPVAHSDASPAPPRSPRKADRRPDGDSITPDCREVLDYLQAATGSPRKLQTPGEIGRALKAGEASVEDLKLVIDWWAARVKAGPDGSFDPAKYFDHVTPFRKSNLEKNLHAASIWQARGCPALVVGVETVTKKYRSPNADLNEREW